MIDEEEKQRMIEFIRNPHPIALEFEAKQVPHDLFKLMGIDDTFSNDYHFVYGADEAEDDEDDITVWPDRIVKSGRATIVFWEDGTKTVVKRSDDEPDNEYNAYLAALGKRIYGSNSALKRLIRDYTVVQKPKKHKKEATGACPIDKPCEKSTVEHDLDALNEQAKKQYEEYLKQNTANDMWTCPKCGKRYQWQYNAEGRYAFCPHCQLATKTEAKA